MRKDATIHVTESTLRKVLPNIIKKADNLDDFIEMLFRDTKKYALRTRNISKVTRATKKKIDKISLVEDNIVGTFQRLLITYRKSINHKRIVPIQQGDSQYPMLKEISKMADDFTKLFAISQNRGYTEFIMRGIKLMKKQYGLNKFKYYYDKIVQQYETVLLIDSDNSPDNTKIFYNIWKKTMEDYGFDGVLDDHDDYVYMVLGRDTADEVNADYEDYIKAQFEQLKNLDIVPTLGAFNGAKAKTRYRQYFRDLVGVSDSTDSEYIKKLKKLQK